MVCSLEVKMNIYAKSNVICSLFLLYPGLLMISLAVSKNIVFAMLPNESPTNDPNSPGNNPPSVFPMTIPAKLSTTVNPMSWKMSRSSKLFPVKIQQLLILLSHLNIL